MQNIIDTKKYFREVLKKLVAIHSVSAQNTGLKQAANYLRQVFEQMGAQTIIDDSYTAPFVFAQFKSKKNNALTITFYNHYDVQPAEPLNLWESDPWELTEKDGKLYGRGVDDDKGNLTARLIAVADSIKEFQELPVNINFIIEGSEETASQNLDKYLKKYQKQLVSDLVIWESGTKSESGELEVVGGNKGIVTFDLIAKSADSDLHSSVAGVVESATWQLIQAISSLRDKNSGEIFIEGLLDDVISPNETEFSLIKKFASSSQQIKKQTGALLPLLIEDEEQFLNRLYFQPSINIEGIQSGYQEEGVKTVLPAYASAKMEIRLVPDMDPDKVIYLVKEQLINNGFPNVQVIKTLGEKGYRSDMSDTHIKQVIDVIKKVTKTPPQVLPTTPGTGPMHIVYSNINSPIAAFGIGYPNTYDHAPNENIRIADYDQHIEIIKELIKSYGQ